MESLEVVVAIPILLVATLAALQLGLLLVVQNAVTAAVIEGAREAAKDSATPDQVAGVVAQHLAVHQIELSTTGGAWVLVEGGAAAGDMGNPSLACLPRGNFPDPAQVRVIVCIRLHDGTSGPVPNWLSSFGFSLAGRRMGVSALAVLE